VPVVGIAKALELIRSPECNYRDLPTLHPPLSEAQRESPILHSGCFSHIGDRLVTTDACSPSTNRASNEMLASCLFNLLCPARYPRAKASPHALLLVGTLSAMFPATVSSVSCWAVCFCCAAAVSWNFLKHG